MKFLRVLLLALILSTFPLFGAFAGDYYQAGTNWDKVPLDAAKLEQYAPGTRKIALGVGKKTGGFSAQAAGGTVFYLGKHNGKHLMATNYHVAPYAGCRDDYVQMAVSGRKYRCTNLIGSWQAIDTAIFEIAGVSPQDEAELAKGALRFKHPSQSIAAGTKLTNIGYGDNRNTPASLAMVDEGPDCMVISGTNDFRHVGDPESGWDPSFMVWSFAHGCEASHGDSGSPLADRETGEVFGILWATAAPKLARVQDTNYLLKLAAGAPDVVADDVWKQLNYAAAAPKIFEFMQSFVKGERSTADESWLDPAARATIAEYLKSYGL